MARGALLSEQPVRMCERPGVVRLRTARQRMPAEPREARDHKRSRENPPPSRNTTQLLEVVQIDALREFLGGADASGHSNTSAPSRRGQRPIPAAQSREARAPAARRAASDKCESAGLTA